MEADERYALLAIRTALFDVLIASAARRGGRLIKTMGDGALIDFASPVDAVACAIEVQSELDATASAETPERRILMRIGINLGDLVEEADGDLFGDGINIAARLKAIADAGGIAISGKVHAEVCGKLDVAFFDHGEVALKNIGRPVRVFSIGGTSVRPAHRAPDAKPGRPAIAVLPFANMSGDAEQDYFADGLVEDIITALSRARSFFVIARNSSFAYKAKAIDVRQIGRELGVRYILEGSVRKGGKRIRITGQLVEAETGHHVWADRFDGGIDDLFEFQDEVTRKVVGAIEPSLRSSEIDRIRTKRTDDLGAYDLYLKGLGELYTFSLGSLGVADALFREAVSRDPSYADAWALIASTSVLRVVGGSITFGEGIEIGRYSARQAVASGEDNPLALASAASTLAFYGLDFEQAAELADRAMILAPNSAQVLSLCGFAYNFCTEFEKALPLLHEARRLSPRDPRGYVTTNQIAMAHFFTRRFDEAIDWTQRNLRQHPSFLPSLTQLAASLAHTGRLDEARATAATALALRPNLRIHPVRARAWRYPWMSELHEGGLRLAGIEDAS